MVVSASGIGIGRAALIASLQFAIVDNRDYRLKNDFEILIKDRDDMHNIKPIIKEKPYWQRFKSKKRKNRY